MLKTAPSLSPVDEFTDRRTRLTDDICASFVTMYTYYYCKESYTVYKGDSGHTMQMCYSPLVAVNILLERCCNPWPHVANRHVSISQLLSSCCYLFTVLNSGLLLYTKRVSTTPTTPSQPRPLPSPTQRHRHVASPTHF